MSGSAYLSGGEYAAYGLPGTTTAADVAGASALLDAYLHRPEGVVWTPDANGLPCYMAALSPLFTLNAAGAIGVGSNVVVPVTGGMVSPDLVGEVLILDRATANKTEACVVSAVGQGSVTLQSVGVAHAAPVTLDGGLVIMEERPMPANRSVSRVTRPQPARMISVQGRYAYGRRNQQQSGVFIDPSILASVQVFGGPPNWNPVDVRNVSVSPATGEVWIPAGSLNASFSDVRMRYVAGYAAANLPDPLKRACASVVTQLQNFPDLVGSVKSIQSGGTKIERFADTLLDVQTRALLGPFEARLFY